MTKKLIYFIDAGLIMKEETHKEISSIEGFKKVYFALSRGVLPSDGYVAEFEVKTAEDAVHVREDLSKIKGIKRIELIHTTL